MSKKRIGWIDVVRCFAMVLIIVGHTYATGFAQYLIYAINVPVFFILSGYLTKMKPLKRVALNGIKTLLIPYVITVLLMLTIGGFNKIFNTRWIYPTNLKQLIVAGIYGIGTPSTITVFRGHNIDAIGAIWFLLAMYIGNILYQLILRIGRLHSDRYPLLIMFIICIILAIVGFEISKFVILPWSMNASLISLIFYFSGHIMKIYKLTELKMINLMLSILGLFLWIMSAVLGPFWFNIGYAAHPTVDVIGAIGGSYFLILLFKYIDRTNWMKLTPYFGRISLIMLSVHIVHIKMFNDVNIISNYLLKIGIGTVVTGILMDLYRLAICLFISFLLSKSILIKRIFAIR